ncbi:MAG: DoxX family protein [Bacteroidota bacterium]
MNTNKILYWVFTGLMCALFTFSGSMYFVAYEEITGEFTRMGFPAWIVYPLGVAKILGVIAVLTKASKGLKEWAYAGFFFNALLATGAHYYAGDGLAQGSTVAIFLVLASKFYDEKLFA